MRNQIASTVRNQIPIRVLIVDNHPIVRLGMEVALSAFPDIRVVGQAHSSEYALAQCAKLQPDIVLMNLLMPQLDGVEATRHIRTQFPKSQVIIFTSFKEENIVQEALLAGAISYLLKDISIQELIMAVRSASSGKMTLSPNVLDVFIHSISVPAKAKSYDLTEREFDVLLQMVEGLTNPEIATNLVVSVNTVRHHVRNILMKLEVGNRTAVVRLAIDEQLVPSKSAHRSYPLSPMLHELRRAR